MGWLSGWSKRVKITIDHDDVNDNLSNFPILLYISGSSGINGEDVTFVFDELGANKLRIAVTKADGLTECYVEVEKWDNTGEEAWLWVKVPDISSSVDTDIYLYFDNGHADNTAYVGIPSDDVVHNVWDTNFKLVTHMRDDPDTSHIRDSTSNNYNGTKSGAGTPAEVSAKINNGQSFDGTDYITIADLDLLIGTWEMWMNFDSLPSVEGLMNPLAKQLQYWLHASNDDTIQAKVKVGATIYVVTTTTDFIETATWYHVVGTYDGETLRLYVNGDEKDNNADPSGDIVAGDLNLTIGTWSTPTDYFEGDGDEVRVSSTVRSSAWIKATYEAGRDHFVDWGTEEESGPSAGWRCNYKIIIGDGGS